MAEGFIRQRGNAWQVIVHAGRDPLTGKRQNLTGTARTKREAQALRARLLTQAAGGRRRPLPPGRLDAAPPDPFYTELRGRGGVGGRPMAPATVRQVHAILRRALDQ